MGTKVLCGDKGKDNGPYYEVEFMHGHGQVSERTYGAIKKECPEQALRTGSGMSLACKAAVQTMQKALGGYVRGRGAQPWTLKRVEP